MTDHQDGITFLGIPKLMFSFTFHEPTCDGDRLGPYQVCFGKDLLIDLKSLATLWQRTVVVVQQYGASSIKGEIDKSRCKVPCREGFRGEVYFSNSAA